MPFVGAFFVPLAFNILRLPTISPCMPLFIILLIGPMMNYLKMARDMHSCCHDCFESPLIDPTQQDWGPKKCQCRFLPDYPISTQAGPEQPRYHETTGAISKDIPINAPEPRLTLITRFAGSSPRESGGHFRRPPGSI